MYTIENLTQLISLGMIFPSLILAIVVVYTWLPSLISTYKTSNPLAHDWFFVGVVFGFLGVIVDNIFWIIPWASAYLQDLGLYTLVPYGVTYNIIFRQFCGVIAAYCHLKAAEITSNSKIKYLNNLLIYSNLFGVFYILFLICIKMF